MEYILKNDYFFEMMCKGKDRHKKSNGNGVVQRECVHKTRWCVCVCVFHCLKLSHRVLGGY